MIEGDLLARGARLQVPPPREGIPHRDARYALRLSGAEIRGSLDLMGGFVAIGGIALDTAHVTGDVVARGAASVPARATPSARRRRDSTVSSSWAMALSLPG